MALMLVAMLVLPGIDAIAKWLSDAISAGQVAWSRFFFQTLLMLPLFLRTRGTILTRALPLHALRGALIALATLLFFSALKYLPLADAISIFFVEPLILTLLSALFLGEAVGWRRLSAVAVGFVGALIVIRPGFGVLGLPALLPLGTALSFAVYLILTRKLAQHEYPERMQFYAGLFGALVMTLALAAGDAADIAALSFVWPDLWQWCLLAGLGIIATAGHLLVVHAFRRAPAGLLAPFQYVEIVGATILGLVFFGDFPDALTWLGVAIIVGSGLYVFHREAALARRARS
ncbi:MAG: EamA family transporter [Gammaproteobacteria bacterium]|nr:EamA family transporter [Gammaproteobacteria bacterium]NIN39665.1 EamA family transporter [Gammaproteobacteria bacterium]NIO25222.1 EamA family transporter [Gammaproteobacteria bacterium]NIO65851.1 EamA family transporter [Gammaproteobacteria bacterium]NIP45713.1 DMT family transporter [Gammaproteobacteria bacterium]